MTGRDRPVCDCSELCDCYAERHAAGKDKAYFEVRQGALVEHPRRRLWT